MEMYMDELQLQSWFQKIMRSEGGLNLNEPASVGGKSYAGISQKSYKQWREKKSRMHDTPDDVEGLSGGVKDSDWAKASPLDVPSEYGVQVDIITDFYKDYFKLAWLDILPECLRYIHADFFVNAKFNANKILQRMVGFEGEDVDGILGPASRARIHQIEIDSTSDDDWIMKYHDLKIEHYESLKEVNEDLYKTNIKGWRRRAQHILGELEEYFVNDEPTVSAIHEDDAIDLFDDPEEEFDKSVQPVVSPESDATELELPPAHIIEQQLLVINEKLDKLLAK